MFSLRKWLYKPKKTDTQLLAQFYYADEELNEVAIELDSFDGRKDPERCTALVNQLRNCQDKVLTIVNEIMDVAIPTERANRDFRVKFPDDVLQDTLAGQLWFGAECLAAGSTIMNREMESAALRPRAKEVIRSLDCLRTAIRDQCLRNLNVYTDKIRETLVTFDQIFSDFEYSYVSAMVPVKTARDYETQQEVVVLFCETIARALKQHLLHQDQIDSCDPALMFTIPRLAIVCGLLVYPEGPLNCDMEPCEMSEMFRPFHSLLYKIRELLHTLSDRELFLLEKALSSTEERWESLENDLSTPTNENCGQSSFDVPVNHRSSSQYGNVISSPSSSSLQSDSSSSTVKIDQSPACSAPIDQSELACTVQNDQSEPVCIQANQPAPRTTANADQSETVHNQTDQSALRNTVQTDSSIERECNITNRTNSQTDYVERDLSMTQGQSESDFIDSDIVSRKLTILPRPGLPSDISVSVDFRQEFATVTIRPETLSNISHGMENVTRDDETYEYVREPHSEVTNISRAESGGSSSSSDSQSDPHSHDRQEQFDVGDAITWCAPTPSETFGARCNSREVHNLCSSIMGDIVERATESVSNNIPPEGATRTMMSVAQGNHNENVQSLSYECLENVDCVTRERCGCTSGENFDSPDEADGSDSSDEFLPEGMIRKSDTVLFKPSGSSTSYQCQVLERGKFVPLKGHDSDFSSPDSPLSDGEDLDRTTMGAGTVVVEGIPQRTLPVVGKCAPTVELSPAGTEGYTADRTEYNHFHNNPLVMENYDDESVGAGSSGQQYPIAGGSNRAIGEAILTQEETYMGGLGDGYEADNGYQWESDESASSTETSSYTSECQDESEISMAIQAAELAAKQQARAHFSSAGDLIHRLFVCISGVADQLQTNFAADLRNILKTVFEVCASEDSEVFQSATEANMEQGATGSVLNPLSEGDHDRRQSRRSRSSSGHEEPPPWVPDEESSNCTSCHALFTVIRRKHHCRNCGMIFCGRCSANSVPLPRYGVLKPVRVCTRCYMFHVTPFLR